MPLTSAERQRTLRKTREREGLKELRGLWLPPEQHKEVKEAVRCMGDDVRVGDVVSYIADERVIYDEVSFITGDIVKLKTPNSHASSIHREQVIKLFRGIKV